MSLLPGTPSSNGVPQPAPGLLSWPQQVPRHAAQVLTDAHMALGFERGPQQAWQQWHQQRLGAMLSWLAQDAAWRRWLAPMASGPQPLQALPVMRRADYRAMVEGTTPRVPAAFGRLGQDSTSGSTGVAVQFWFSELHRRLNASTYWADNLRQGRRLEKGLAVLTGHPPKHAGDHLEPPPDPWLVPGPQRARHSPGFSVEEHAHWLCRVAPEYLSTYPSLLSGLLAVIEIEGLPAPRVAQVMTFAETVEPALRERCRRILGARIADRYSCEEIGPIAFQCPDSDAHYHASVATTVVEVVDDAGRPLPHGEQGSVLVTGLHQWASPALRYELGDIATLLPHCPACGVTVPTLTALLGRKRALIRRPGGGFVYVRVTAHDWLECAPVREHRMVQTGEADFRIEVVADEPLTAEHHAAIRAMLGRRIGEGFRYDVRQLAAIPWPPGRKRQELVGLDALEPRP